MEAWRCLVQCRSGRVCNESGKQKRENQKYWNNTVLAPKIIMLAFNDNSYANLLIFFCKDSSPTWWKSSTSSSRSGFIFSILSSAMPSLAINLMIESVTEDAEDIFTGDDGKRVFGGRWKTLNWLYTLFFHLRPLSRGHARGNEAEQVMPSLDPDYCVWIIFSCLSNNATIFSISDAH